jgi:hypothetical protein
LRQRRATEFRPIEPRGDQEKAEATMNRPLAHLSAVVVLASVVLMWGLTWTVTKAIVGHVAPL